MLENLNKYCIHWYRGDNRYGTQQDVFHVSLVKEDLVTKLILSNSTCKIRNRLNFL